MLPLLAMNKDSNLILKQCYFFPWNFHFKSPPFISCHPSCIQSSLFSQDPFKVHLEIPFDTLVLRNFILTGHIEEDRSLHSLLTTGIQWERPIPCLFLPNQYTHHKVELSGPQRTCPRVISSSISGCVCL